LRNLLTERYIALFWQLFKYGLCGGIGAVTYAGIVVAIHFFIPDFVDSELNSANQLLWNTNIVNTAAFIPSTILSYILNRAFVFEAGRHKVWFEFWSFMIIALISFFAGILGTFFIMRTYNVEAWVGNIAFTIPSLLVNFVCRKFFVFKN